MKNLKFYSLLTFLLLSIILASIFKNKEETRIISRLESISKPKVLILELFSPIIYTESSFSSGWGIRDLIEQIDEAAKDDNVKGLILRVNSPGGAFGASEEFYQAMVRFRKNGKPLVSSVIDICASGGYYAVLPSDLIIANRGAIVGSIGVRITSIDLTKLYKKVGIGFNQITSGDYKDILSESRAMTPEEREHLQKMVNSSHQIFVGDVVKWRQDKSDESTLRKAANGLIYAAQEAKQLGLIDKLGGMGKAKEEMAALLKLPINEINFSYPNQFFYPGKGFFFSLIHQVKSEIKALINELLWLDNSLSPTL